MKKSRLKQNQDFTPESSNFKNFGHQNIYVLISNNHVCTVKRTPERKKKDNAGFKLRGLSNHDHF